MAGQRNRRTLVLGSGGDAASAWEIGLATGLEERGISLKNAGLFVGTSAGARVAIQLASGVGLEELFRRQIDLKLHASEEAPHIDWKQWRSEITKARDGGGDTREILRRVGKLALARPQESAAARREFVASQLPIHAWPDKGVLISAVNAETGERRVFDKNSGVDLIDAVVASGAVAGVWPPVLIDGQPYMDGGFYATENADIAVGLDRVLILALRAGNPPMSVVLLESALDTLRGNGATVEVVHPDSATESVIAAAGSLLNPTVRVPAAKAGRAQGRRIATKHLLAFWNHR